MKVLVVGGWHLGSVVSACLAKAGNHVSLWDQNSKVEASWKSGTPPIHEPGLKELTALHWQKNLFWVGDLKEAAPQAEWIVLAYDTPINDRDEIVIDQVIEGFRAVLDAGISENSRFLFTSQLPIGTSEEFRSQILSRYPQWKGHVTYQPENLRLGEAIKCFETPDRMVLGIDAKDKATRDKVILEFRDLTKNPTTPINVMSLSSAEMVKHALNSFLATCVVFANELSEICESTGADAWDVVASLKQDSRVGPKAFLRPGLGFSGGTLARDVKTLSSRTKKQDATNFFSRLYDINVTRNDWVKELLTEHIGDLKGKKVTLLGVTYKPFTSTVRRSPALEIGNLLKSHGVECVAIDPMADMNELTKEELDVLPYSLLTDWESAFEGSSAAIVVTEWPQFLELNWSKLKSLMKIPLVIDSKNLFGNQPIGLDFTVRVPGKSALWEI